MELCWLIIPKINFYCILMFKVKNEKATSSKILYAGE